MPQHSLPLSVFLHLCPGVVILGLYLLLQPLFTALGYPPLVALLAAAVVVVGLELGHLVREGYRRNGRCSLSGIVLYCNKSKPLPFAG